MKGCWTATGKLRVDSTYEAKMGRAHRTVFGGSTWDKSVLTVGGGGRQQLRHTRGERTSCRRTTVHTVEQLPARLVVGTSHFYVHVKSWTSWTFSFKEAK